MSFHDAVSRRSSHTSSDTTTRTGTVLRTCRGPQTQNHQQGGAAPVHQRAIELLEEYGVETGQGLSCHGYRLKDMVEQFDAKAAEIRAMFSNQLEPKRTAEIRERMLAAGLPI